MYAHPMEKFAPRMSGVSERSQTAGGCPRPQERERLARRRYRVNPVREKSRSAIRLAIENTFDPDAPPARRKGIGQANVRKRLHSHYGNRAGLRATAEGDRYRVDITLPAEENGGA